SRQVSRHPRWFPILIQNQPVWMVFHYLGDGEFTSRLTIVTIFYAEGKPPDLRFDSLIVKLLDHLLYSIAGKCIGAWLPIAIVVVPAIVESRPMDSQLLQLGNNIKHLFHGDIVFVSPTAPTHGVVLTVACRLVQAFAL